MKFAKMIMLKQLCKYDNIEKKYYINEEDFDKFIVEILKFYGVNHD